jgi:hypothetical protein
MGGGGGREFCMSPRETATVEWARACARGEDAEMARTARALAKCSMEWVWEQGVTRE